MAVRLQFKIDGEVQLSRELGITANRITDFGKPLGQIEREINKSYQMNFESRGALFGGWARRKVGRAWPLLEKTGRLRGGYRSTFNKTTLTIWNPVPYFPYHQRGTSRLPARVILKLDDIRRDFAVKAFQAFIVQATRGEAVMAIYRDPVIARLIELFNAEGPAEFKNRYFYGDPLMVPGSALPAAFITKDVTDISNLSVAEDQSRMTMAVNVVTDLRRDFQQAFNNIAAMNTVYDVVEGRDSSYNLKPTSLAYILRSHQQNIANKMWINPDEPLQTDYGIGIEKRGPGIFTVEGIIKFMILHHQMAPGL